MLPVVARLVVPAGLEVGVGDVCWGWWEVGVWVGWANQEKENYLCHLV